MMVGIKRITVMCCACAERIIGDCISPTVTPQTVALLEVKLIFCKKRKRAVKSSVSSLGQMYEGLSSVTAQG